MQITKPKFDLVYIGLIMNVRNLGWGNILVQWEKQIKTEESRVLPFI